MTNTVTALYAFWSGFGVPAYPEDQVPTDAQMPYITYTVVEPEQLQNATHQARVWTKSESVIEPLSRIVDAITDEIGRCKALRTDGGMLRIYPGNPYVQMQPIDAPDLKVAYLNFQINNYQMR